MNYIATTEQRINLNFETQYGKNQRPFRLSGISLDVTKPPKWINKMHLHYTKYTFRYLDEQDGFFTLLFDYDNKFVCKL